MGTKPLTAHLGKRYPFLSGAITRLDSLNPFKQVAIRELASNTALHSKCVLTSPKIIGYREKCIIVWASNTKIPLTSEIPITQM